MGASDASLTIVPVEPDLVISLGRKRLRDVAVMRFSLTLTGAVFLTRGAWLGNAFGIITLSRPILAIAAPELLRR